MGKSQNKPNSTMFRFVALFALVAVALAEPEADAQFLVNPINTVVGAPVVNTYAEHVVRPVNTYTNTHVRPVVYNKVVPVVQQVVRPIQYHVPVVKPVVKYVDAHHTDGMTAEGVPEKTDSVKIAEKQHELAKALKNQKLRLHTLHHTPPTAVLHTHTSTTLLMLSPSVKLIPKLSQNPT